MHFIVLIFIITSLGLVGISSAHSCDDLDDKEKLLLGKPNCGDGQCRCEDKSARCVGNRTTHVVPRLEQTIKELYLECYSLQNLNPESFVNIKKLHLRSIHLLRNRIGNISKDIFEKFNLLTNVEISDNAQIDKAELYTALGSLQKNLTLNLTFNNTGIKNITDAFFQNLNKSNVIYLSFSKNMIETLNLTVLSQLPSLRELHLDHNWLNGFTGEDQLKRLHTLDLSQNELHSKGANFCLPNGNSSIPNINTLLLSSNLISKLDNAYLSSWSCLNSLKILHLKNNTIKTINISSFSNMTSLKELDVSSNWIRKLVAGEYPPKLKTINFRNNQFVAFPPNLCEVNNRNNFTSIHVLNFSRNYIQKINTTNWVCLPNITVLDFSKNDVSELKNNTFVNFSSLRELYIDNMIPWVKKIEPAAFNSSSLQTLSIRFDWIDFSKEEYQHLFKFCPNVKRIDISFNYFLKVNESTLVKILSPMKNLEILNAQRISRKKFPFSLLTFFKNLKHLDINRNLLDTIQFPDSFNDPSLNLSIRYISAAEGDINSIDQSAFPYSIMNALDTLDISDNEFACNCEMQWFRDKITLNGRIGKIQLLDWPEKYVCRSPTNLVDTLFKDFEPDEECWHMTPIVVAFIAIGCSMFVFTVLSLIMYYNKWYMQYYWYRFNRWRRRANSRQPEEQPILDEIQYDGYVVCHPSDEELVHHSFRNMMENKLNYKLHIWKRDAASGALVDVILDAIYASEHVIVVVSNKLMKNQWCKFQVDVAIEKSIIDHGRNCVLLVVLEDLDFDVISKSWCVLLAKSPTAYWSNTEDESDIKKKFFKQTVKRHLGIPLRNRANGCANDGRR